MQQYPNLNKHNYSGANNRTRALSDVQEFLSKVKEDHFLTIDCSELTLRARRAREGLRLVLIVSSRLRAAEKVSIASRSANWTPGRPYLS